MLNRFEAREKATAGFLEKAARELSVPPFALMMRAPLPLSYQLPDFRSTNPTPGVFERQTLEAIEQARAIQRRAVAFGHSSNPLPASRLDPGTLEQTAARFRRFLRLSDQRQYDCKDALEFYRLCRFEIERHGIFILHRSFPSVDGSGFCLADPPAPIICVNTMAQTAGRRLFTLAHELAHVTIGASGVSDPFIRKNDTEIICNKFAAALLAPKSLVSRVVTELRLDPNPSRVDIARVAKRLKISQQASVIRLEELQYVSAGTHRRWLTGINVSGDPDTETGGGGGGPTPQHKVKLARFGFSFAKVFGAALRDGALAPIDLYRLTGLKPKYQSAYFNFASLARYDDAEEE
ncbi:MULTISPECIES: ImmA/IrrE family metallo-endopeptidase [Roseomonadaceae]|uniref:ImmA/IrrE family metallo-endopeptidase n=1 Tax=Falsiroseomonas oleicola TaxID=2801474 RepID=A0ABS6H860_9PROT|nr:ImmA/IrrE family metallo-endopeptidase [Roseomonas oleicola]MBU8544890.1 ImmA/IrrE family metallo-endopeptidase [Roseomonas oleicola]